MNLAGRQRMLSQRMVKAYVMLVQGVAADDARTLLQQSVDQFESQLGALLEFQPNATVREALAKLGAEWTKCRALLSARPGMAGAVDLYDASEALLKAAHQTTLAYESVGGTAHGHLINLAGRQRMLSQRMAKLYFYRVWDYYRDAADMEMHLSRAHFTAVLSQIEVSPLASEQIKSAVVQLRREWDPYEKALFASREPATVRQNGPRVAELSERVLAATESLVTLIAEQARLAGPPGG